MNKTNIEWVRNPDGSQGYTWNPITGCLNNCGYCYARKLANGRLKPLYLANKNYITWRNTSIDFYDDKENGGQFYKAEIDAPFDPFYPRFWPDRLSIPQDWRTLAGVQKVKPRGIFPCDMGELFGDWIPNQWIKCILSYIKSSPQHRFYILTKQPQNLPRWSPFPENVYLGVTATGRTSLKAAFWHLAGIKAKVKYLSLEPLLEEPPTSSLLACIKGVDWLIIGACTGSWVDMAKLCLRYGQLTLMAWGKRWTAQPPIEWLSEIVDAADKVGTPLFLKNNLMPLFEAERIKPEDGRGLRQEMPG